MMPAPRRSAPRFTPLRTVVSTALLVALNSGASFCAEPEPLPTLTPPTASSADTVFPPSEPWSPPGRQSASTSPAELPSAEAAAGLSDETKNLIIEEQWPWYSPAIWLGPEPWDSGVELGLNGSS